MKNTLDKFYTAPTLAARCKKRFDELVQRGADDVIIEPSAGNGSFADLFFQDETPHFEAYDLKPEHPRVIEQDFLTFDFEQYGNRAIHFIGNPPFGTAATLATKFIEKMSSHPFTQSFSLILPASCTRVYYKNRINTDFHVVYEELCDEFIEFGKPKTINCVFQVWIRKDEKRKIVEKRWTSDYFKFVKSAEEADFMIGSKKQSGRIMMPNAFEIKNKQQAYFIKMYNDEHRRLCQTYADIQFKLVYVNKKEFIAAPNTSKPEIVYYIEKFLKRGTATLFEVKAKSIKKSTPKVKTELPSIIPNPAPVSAKFSGVSHPVKIPPLFALELSRGGKKIMHLPSNTFLKQHEKKIAKSHNPTKLCTSIKLDWMRRSNKYLSDELLVKIKAEYPEHFTDVEFNLVRENMRISCDNASQIAEKFIAMWLFDRWFISFHKVHLLNRSIEKYAKCRADCGIMAEVKKQAQKIKTMQPHPDSVKSKNLLELFAGTGSVGKVAKERGYNVVSLDLNGDVTHKINIMDWDYKAYPVGYFKIIHGSPPCDTFSILRRSWIGRKLKHFGDKIVTAEMLDDDMRKVGVPVLMRTLEIIEYFQPQYYTIENPFGGKMKDYLCDLDCQVVSYCKYAPDWGYQKDTCFWTNSKSFKGLRCVKGCYCAMKQEHGRHRITLGCKTTQGSTTLNERYRVPPKLITDLFDSMQVKKKKKKLIIVK